ncbi:TolB family protein [bacterium]|nr:TolB family protein [bacterium]
MLSNPAVILFTAAFAAALFGGKGSASGPFKFHADVGDVSIPGSFTRDPASGAWRMTASGENLWGEKDAFHFAWNRCSGDLLLECGLEWVGEGMNPHRKAGVMVRASLDPDAAYADAVVHGDGLVSLQFRRVKGGPTEEVRAPLPGARRIRLERDGNVFSFSLDRDGSGIRPVAALSVRLPDTVLAGLFVCSHDNSVSETALFRDVRFASSSPVQDDRRIVESTLEILDLSTRERSIVLRETRHFEAPNWSRDGKTLLFNSEGRIFHVPASGGETRVLDTGDAARCNNDHGLSFDGQWLAISHSPENQSLIYILPASGGVPRLVTQKGPSYWHGWSPDGNELAYCAERNGAFDVYTIPVSGGEEKRLTDAPGLDDGPEYTPDGKWIYFNSVRTGLMKIWRMRPDGSEQQQMTFGDRHGDWFPHPSPDGKQILFLSYDASVQGHPANQDVCLRLMPAEGGEPETVAVLFGGQGTINVPSWSPDGTRAAFVSYRLVSRPAGEALTRP